MPISRKQPQPRRRARPRYRTAARLDSRHYQQRARLELRRFRRASTLAVAVTGALLLLFSGTQQQDLPGSSAVLLARAPTVASAQDTSTADRVQQAARPVRELGQALYRALPRFVIAFVVLAAAAVLTRIARPGLRRVFHGWQRADASTALVVLGIWILAAGAALSVIAGDVRALVGSVGLFGLALSWSLQTPIESFTGWLLNSFRGYYRVGDRIGVGDVFGDVYAIDMLTTTVWEAGGPDKSVTAAQPTGALITFPNSEVLRANIINYTRDFPYVWDEVTVGVANESDIPHAMRLLRETATRVLGEAMAAPASSYQMLLRSKQLDYDVAVEPEVFVTPRDAWTDLIVRYLVPARERRKWSTALILALNEAASAPEHRERVIPAYPRRQIQVLSNSDPLG